MTRSTPASLPPSTPISPLDSKRCRFHTRAQHLHHRKPQDLNLCRVHRVGESSRLSPSLPFPPLSLDPDCRPNMHPLPLGQIVQRMISPPVLLESNPSIPASVEAWRQAALASFLGLPSSASPTVDLPADGGTDGTKEDSNYAGHEAKEYWTAKGGAAVDEKRKEAEECLLAWAQIEPAVSLLILPCLCRM
jgi:hypothetical protein